jgi:hypothetical protein
MERCCTQPYALYGNQVRDPSSSSFLRNGKVQPSLLPRLFAPERLEEHAAIGAAPGSKLCQNIFRR